MKKKITNIKLNYNNVLKHRHLLNNAFIKIAPNEEAHLSEPKWSKWHGTNYELAELHTHGLGNIPSRPFVYLLRRKLDTEYKGVIAKVIKKYSFGKRGRNGGTVIDWESVADFLNYELIPRCLAEIPLQPLTVNSLKKKRQYGYPSTQLVATGQLYESVRAEVIYE